MANSEFVNSNVSQDKYFKTLTISNWSYNDFVISAIYFYLETLYLKFLNRENNKKENVFHELKPVSGEIGFLFLNPLFGELLFTTIQQTNLFSQFPDIWLYGFTRMIYHRSVELQYPEKHITQKHFFNEITYNFSDHFSGNFSNISLYLIAFHFFIPTEIIYFISAYCIETQSTCLIYYVLKQYENFFNKNQSEKEKCFNNYCLNKALKKELDNNSSEILVSTNFKEKIEPWLTSLINNLNLFLM